MLETYTLKKHLETVRQELSHALYEHDAACRVIARVIKERDEARQAFGELQQHMQSIEKQAPTGIEEEMAGGAGAGGSGLPAAMLEKISQKSVELQTARKLMRKNPEATKDFSTTEVPPAPYTSVLILLRRSRTSRSTRPSRYTRPARRASSAWISAPTTSSS